jgi:threonine dehydrogenase-like Zn-dependent dehydrogenase
VPGVYTGPIHGFLFGDAFDKGLSFRMGQTHCQQHMPELLDRIGEGRLDPAVIISHRLPLSRAAEGYTMFDNKEDDCRKVVLVPD